MTLHAFCIYDRKGTLFHAPFFAVSAGAAVRSFSDLVNDPNTTVGRHPSDYVLYRVGSFDDQSGSLSRTDLPEHVSDASSLIIQSGPLPFAKEQ